MSGVGVKKRVSSPFIHFTSHLSAVLRDRHVNYLHGVAPAEPEKLYKSYDPD